MPLNSKFGDGDDVMGMEQAFWSLILLVFLIGIIVGAFAMVIKVSNELPNWNARLCIQDYDTCHSVHFYSQSDFVAYCEARNGWYQISSTTTCIEKKAVK